jgi:tRNA G10  N-methylase Trm11
MKEMLANDWRSSMYNFLMQEASDTLYRLTDLAKLRLNVEVVYYGGVDTASCVPVNDMRVAAVITSPPYLQAQEYIRTSKLELFWLGYSEDEVKRISRLEIPYRKAPCAVSTHYLAALRSRLTSHKLRELVDSYFYYTLRALENASAFLVPGGRLCVFVGNPKVDGIEVETWKVISEYFEPKGFVRERVYEDRIKNRQLFRGRRNKNPEGIKSEYLVVLRRI